jgi:NADH-quinone oxidoreductase subunit J
VAVTIAFAIMLAAPEQSRKVGKEGRGPLVGPLGFATAALFAGGFSILAFRTEWKVMDKINDGSMKTIGIQLLTDYSMVFELISIVLLIAILGALVLARAGRDN